MVSIGVSSTTRKVSIGNPLLHPSNVLYYRRHEIADFMHEVRDQLQSGSTWREVRKEEGVAGDISFGGD